MDQKERTQVFFLTEIYMKIILKTNREVPYGKNIRYIDMNIPK